MVTVIKVITKPKYLILFVSIALFVIIFAAWLPNLHLITQSMTSADMTFWQKTNLLVGLFGSLQTNFTLLSRAITITSAILTGIQISLLIFYFRQTAKLQQTIGMSFAGIVSSMLGVGCASCGSVILTSLIGLGSTTAFLGVLPLKGQEFGIMSIGILILAIHLTIKKIDNPFVCKIK